MDRIMSNIKMVQGVSGVMVIDKARALTYQMMPASMSPDSVKELAIELLHLGRTIEKNLSLDLFFESGLARLYNRPEQVVLILGRPDMNFNALSVVCREAIPAISRKLSKGQLGISSPGAKDHKESDLELLISALNIISAKCVEKIGAYMVTRNLRRAKDELAGKYPIITAIMVDNNGIVSLIKGIQPGVGKDSLKAFAHWANLFLSYCANSTNKLKPEDILDLTFEIKDRLDLAGFYQIYSDVAV